MDLKKVIQQYIPFNEQERVDQHIILSCMEQMKDIYTRENAIAHFTASSWIVNKDHTKVLMIYHNILDSWAWTGGHADGEKDLLSVALKEAKEETGLTEIRVMSDQLYSLEVLPVPGHVKYGKYVNAHIHLNVTFLLEADENESIRIKEDENSAISWYPIEDAPKKARERDDQILYQKLNDKLNLINND